MEGAVRTDLYDMLYGFPVQWRGDDDESRYTCKGQNQGYGAGVTGNRAWAMGYGLRARFTALVFAFCKPTSTHPTQTLAPMEVLKVL